MYCLILLYHAMHDELRPFHPLGKFICVKAVVFFSFWQSVALAVIVKLGFISANANWSSYTVESVSAGIQDFLMCVEMLFAAIAHS